MKINWKSIILAVGVVAILIISIALIRLTSITIKDLPLQFLFFLAALSTMLFPISILTFFLNLLLNLVRRRKIFKILLIFFTVNFFMDILSLSFQGAGSGMSGIFPLLIGVLSLVFIFITSILLCLPSKIKNY